QIEIRNLIVGDKQARPRLSVLKQGHDSQPFADTVSDPDRPAAPLIPDSRVSPARSPSRRSPRPPCADVPSARRTHSPQRGISGFRQARPQSRRPAGDQTAGDSKVDRRARPLRSPLPTGNCAETSPFGNRVAQKKNRLRNDVTMFSPNAS